MISCYNLNGCTTYVTLFCVGHHSSASIFFFVHWVRVASMLIFLYWELVAGTALGQEGCTIHPCISPSTCFFYCVSLMKPLFARVKCCRVNE